MGGFGGVRLWGERMIRYLGGAFASPFERVIYAIESSERRIYFWLV